MEIFTCLIWKRRNKYRTMKLKGSLNSIYNWSIVSWELTTKLFHYNNLYVQVVYIIRIRTLFWHYVQRQSFTRTCDSSLTTEVKFVTESSAQSEAEIREPLIVLGKKLHLLMSIPADGVRNTKESCFLVRMLYKPWWVDYLPFLYQRFPVSHLNLSRMLIILPLSYKCNSILKFSDLLKCILKKYSLGPKNHYRL